MRFRQLDAHKQVLAAHRLVGALRHRVAIGRGGTRGRLLLRMGVGMTARRQHLDGQGFGRHALAIDHHRCGANVALAALGGLVNHGVLLAGRVARLAVDPRRTVAVRHAGAIDEFGTRHLGRGEIAALAVVEYKRDVELVALDHLARSLDGERCRLSDQYGKEQDDYVDDAFH